MPGRPPPGTSGIGGQALFEKCAVVFVQEMAKGMVWGAGFALTYVAIRRLLGF
jgi:hypothetical protein